ncbi:MAG TPA: 3-isopropylmalate dehydratase small subunit [Kofleriaceae bacterium]|nr:3-isopropylmalate dehydratase small subunit [Kofleriaceae bacterium]
MTAKFTTLTSYAVLLPRDDIDTDQIIPARFLKVTSKDGLAEHLFSDWRYDDAGRPRADFALNREEGAVLIAGHNFGCGSSREHAPWALTSYGFRAVVATSFADIFRNNALKNGLVPVEVSKPDHARLVAARQKDAALEVTVDLDAQTVSWPGQAPIQFPVDPFARRCLLDGTDELGYLLSLEPEISRHEARTR